MLTSSPVDEFTQYPEDAMTAAELKQAPIDALELSPFEVPSLDGMNAKQLAAMEWVLDRLSQYCHHRRHAMKLRAAGDIHAARSFEAIADRYYAMLPRWARW